MGVSIDGNKIKMTRGDTFIIKVNLWKKDDPDDPEEEPVPYVPEPGDTVRFALKHSDMNRKHTEFIDEEPLARIEIPTDTMILEIEPKHTKSLGFGKNYVYDIEITFADGRVRTFIEDAPFELTREVD